MELGKRKTVGQKSQLGQLEDGILGLIDRYPLGHAPGAVELGLPVLLLSFRH